MRHSIVIVLLGCAGCLISATQLMAGGAVSDQAIGLSRSSVFDAPQPAPYTYRGNFPGQKPVLPRSYSGAPPQIPHNIEAFLPVTQQQNACLGCHLLPEQAGTVIANQPTPIPKSHYTDLRNAPDKVTKKLIGVRGMCTQCHVPQAEVDLLVGNSFKKEGE